MWPRFKFFSTGIVVSADVRARAFDYNDAEQLNYIKCKIDEFNLRLSALQSMDKHIMAATIAALGSYLSGYSLLLAACSSFLTIAIERRIDFYPSYREILDELLSISEWCKEKNQDVLTVLKPFLAANNQTDTWFFRLYGETATANPLRVLLPPPVWLGVDAAVDLVFPARP